MANEEKELRGLLVGEARSIVESQVRIENKLGIGLVVSGVTLAVLVLGFALSLGSLGRLGSKVTGAVASITDAVGKINSAAESLRAGSNGSQAELAAIRKKLDGLNGRLRKMEVSLDTGTDRRLVATSYSSKDGGSSKSKKAKKGGCLGIF